MGFTKQKYAFPIGFACLRIQGGAVKISGSWKAEKNEVSGGLVLNDFSGNFAVKISLFSEVKIDGKLENDINHRNAHKWDFCERRSVSLKRAADSLDRMRLRRLRSLIRDWNSCGETLIPSLRQCFLA
jgi:hypothetical protein